jgi:hypothetical protein
MVEFCPRSSDTLVTFVTKYTSNCMISVRRYLDFRHSIMSFQSSEMACGTQDRSVMIVSNSELPTNLNRLLIIQFVT